MSGAKTTARVWDYAKETGQDTREIYMRLIVEIAIANPEAVDAAFTKLRELDALQLEDTASNPDLPSASVSCAKAKI